MASTLFRSSESLASLQLAGLYPLTLCLEGGHGLADGVSGGDDAIRGVGGMEGEASDWLAGRGKDPLADRGCTVRGE